MPEREPTREALHAELRRQTAPLHRELDSLPFLARLLKPDLSKAHYLQVVRAFHSFIDPLERQVFAVSELGACVPDFERRRRAFLLADDIKALEGDKAMLPPPVSIDVPMGSLGSAFGVLYVLEGSTLGGALVAARVKATLGVVPGQGGSFFNARGEWAGPAWSSFLAALEMFAGSASLTRDDRGSAACTSARATFQSLIAHFRRAGEVTS